MLSKFHIAIIRIIKQKIKNKKNKKDLKFVEKSKDW